MMLANEDLNWFPDDATELAALLADAAQVRPPTFAQRNLWMTSDATALMGDQRPKTERKTP